MTSLFQIYYKDDQLKKIYPWAIPVENKGLTIFFENEVISNVVKKFDGEKVGVCSWKLSQKMRKGDCLTKPFIEGDYQVLSFTRNSDRHSMKAFLGQWHHRGVEGLELLWQKLGYKLPNDAKQPIYQNAYMAKTELYRDYVENFLSPAMELISTDEQLNEIMKMPTKYASMSKDSDVKSVKEKTGLDSYPLCPFVLERCPSFWFTMKKINVSYLPNPLI